MTETQKHLELLTKVIKDTTHVLLLSEYCMDEAANIGWQALSKDLLNFIAIKSCDAGATNATMEG